MRLGKNCLQRDRFSGGYISDNEEADAEYLSIVMLLSSAKEYHINDRAAYVWQTKASAVAWYQGRIDGVLRFARCKQSVAWEVGTYGKNDGQRRTRPCRPPMRLPCIRGFIFPALGERDPRI